MSQQQFSEIDNNKLFVETLKKVIEANNVYETSDSITQMYRIGENEAIVVITRNNVGNVVSAACKLGDICKTFLVSDSTREEKQKESEFAIELSHACSVKSIKMNQRTNNKPRTR